MTSDLCCAVLFLMTVLHRCKWLFPILLSVVWPLQWFFIHLGKFSTWWGSVCSTMRWSPCTMLRRGGKGRSWSGHHLRLSSSSWSSCSVTVSSQYAPSLAYFRGCAWLLFHHAGYIGEFEYVDDHRAGKIVVELNGRLNKCGVISPRFDVGVKEIEGWTARLLPSRQASFLSAIWLHL